MCLVVAPMIPFISLLTGLISPPPPGQVAAPQPPPQQGAQQVQQTQQAQQANPNLQTQQNQQTNDIENFEDFMSQFDRTYTSAAEQTFRQNLFTQNLNIINVGLKYSVTNQAVHL